jgi:hypothetical protein
MQAAKMALLESGCAAQRGVAVHKLMPLNTNRKHIELRVAANDTPEATQTHWDA